MNNSSSDHLKSQGQDVKQDAKSMAETARQGAGQAASEMVDHARRAAADVSETAELTIEQLKEQIDSLKTDLAGLARSVRGAGTKYVGDNLDELRNRTETFTQERPLAALGLAACAGFVLAHLTSRR